MSSIRIFRFLCFLIYNFNWYDDDYKVLILCLIYISQKNRIGKGYLKIQEMPRKQKQRKIIMNERIKKLRKIKGLTQTELAERIGVSRTAIYDWERGAYMPEGANLRKLAEMLDTTVGYLVGETPVWARYGDIPETERTREQWDSIQNQVTSQSEAQARARRTMGRYVDPELGIFEIIGDMARMQEATRKNYKHYRERELIVLSSQLDAYRDLVLRIRELQQWEELDGNDEEKH